MRRLRVLHVCNALGIGGTEKTLQILCKYLDKTKFEVFACGRLHGGVRVTELEKLGIPVHVQPQDMNSLIRELKIDICHVHRAGDHEPGSLPNRNQGLPHVVETNVFQAFDRVEDELIDAHLFVSAFSLNRYLVTYGRRTRTRYEVLYNPIDFDEFPVYPKRFDYTIGRCSRPDDQKWHDVCLDSLPKIIRKISQTRCVFQGVTDRVRQRLAALNLDGRFQILEPSLNVAELYRRLDVFMHGSRIGETFGCVIAEAMANQVAVVTLSTPQRKKANAQVELVENNVTGFVCRWQWQYAGAVIELLQNQGLRETFARRGYEKARDQFDAARVTRKLEHLYLELMDTRM